MTEEPADFLTLVRSPVAVRELAADTLRQAIIRGDLLPGGRLVEAELSKRMGVSRPSIREALSQLAAEKLVTIVPNKGPSVANISWKEAQEIYHVRSLVEGEASFLFAGRASKADLAGMRSALKAFEQAMARDVTPGLVTSTGAFYSIMLNGCGNRIITVATEQERRAAPNRLRHHAARRTHGQSRARWRIAFGPFPECLL